MGPFGSEGDYDQGYQWGSVNIPWYDGGYGWVKLDLSTTSIDWINTHYTGPDTKGDTVWYGIYDFLTDAYPKGNFTEFLYNVKISSRTPSINTIFKTLSDYIGLNGMGKNELNDKHGVGFNFSWKVLALGVHHVENGK